VRRHVIAFALLLAGAVATEAASRFIVNAFPDRPLPGDLLFRLLPHVPAASTVSSVAISLGVALFVVYAIRHAPGRIPSFVTMLGVMYLLRSALLVATPLANAHEGLPAAFPVFRYGMFPSGHTAAMLLFAFFIDPAEAPTLHRAQCLITTLVCVCLVLAHSHFTIDIAGGALLAYFVEREWRLGCLFGPLKRLVELPGGG